MRVAIDELARQEIIDRIREKMVENPRDLETPIHLSDLTRCITRTFFDKDRVSRNQGNVRANASMIDERGALYMYIGILGEKAVEELAPSTETVEVHRITATPDWELKDGFVELKTTRIYISKKNDMPSKGWSHEWLRRIAGYAYMFRQNTWKLGLLLVIPGDLKVYDFYFTADELENFWSSYIMPRRDVLEEAIETGNPPKAYAFNDDYECARCPYSMACEFGTGFNWVDEESIGRPAHDRSYSDRADSALSPLVPQEIL